MLSTPGLASAFTPSSYAQKAWMASSEVTLPVIHVWWKTCSVACARPLPGGRWGPTTTATIGVATTLSAIHATRTLRPELDHIEEPVHVADRLHRTAEAVDPARGTRDE